LPIPTFQATVEGRNVARQVGDINSGKPIRVSQATRSDVLRLLGTPYAVTEDGRGLPYSWTVLHGVTVWPLCFYADPVRGARTLILRFDENDVLRSTEVLKRDEPVIQWNSMDVTPPLPEGAQRAQQPPAPPATAPSPMR